MRTRTMKPLFLIFCLCLSPLLMGQNQNKIQEAMANYDYETAVELINKEPPTIPLLMQKAKALKGIGSNAEALRSIRQVIAEDSTNQQAHIEAAECCKAMAKYNDALDYYRKAISLNPKNKYARLQFINLLCNTKNYAEAFGESSMMSETDSSAVVLHLQAQSLEGMQQILPAIGCYEVIQDKYPDDYLAAAKLGNLNIVAGYPEYAIQATERYRERDSTNLIVNQQNALAYCHAEQYPTAIKRYEKLCQQGTAVHRPYTTWESAITQMNIITKRTRVSANCKKRWKKIPICSIIWDVAAPRLPGKRRHRTPGESYRTDHSQRQRHDPTLQRLGGLL